MIASVLMNTTITELDITTLQTYNKTNLSLLIVTIVFQMINIVMSALLKLQFKSKWCSITPAAKPTEEHDGKI